MSRTNELAVHKTALIGISGCTPAPTCPPDILSQRVDTLERFCLQRTLEKQRQQSTGAMGIIAYTYPSALRWSLVGRLVCCQSGGHLRLRRVDLASHHTWLPRFGGRPYLGLPAAHGCRQPASVKTPCVYLLLLVLEIVRSGLVTFAARLQVPGSDPSGKQPTANGACMAKSRDPARNACAGHA